MAPPNTVLSFVTIASSLSTRNDCKFNLPHPNGWESRLSFGYTVYGNGYFGITTNGVNRQLFYNSYKCGHNGRMHTSTFYGCNTLPYFNLDSHAIRNTGVRVNKLDKNHRYGFGWHYFSLHKTYKSDSCECCFLSVVRHFKNSFKRFFTALNWRTFN